MMTIMSGSFRHGCRSGFHATSMQDLFAEAGLSSGAVYLYFPGQDDVIVAIAKENMRDVTEMIHDAAIRRPGSSAGATTADVLEIVRAKNAENGLTMLGPAAVVSCPGWAAAAGAARCAACGVSRGRR